jgi:hypothetical protein
VDYDDESSLIEAFKGKQFLIICMNARVAPDTQIKLIKAAAKAGVPWVMPNSWGPDVNNEKMMMENLTGPAVLPGIRAIEKAGVSSWITLCCSFWYEFSLALPDAYGIDEQNNKVTFFGDGKNTFDTSTWQQCGRAVASLLSLKQYPEDENDKSTTISEWTNKPAYVSSFNISQRDMLDSINRVSGRTDKDWDITYEGHKERYDRGIKLMKEGHHAGFSMALYTRVLDPNGDGNFTAKHGLANEKLGLPKEDLDEATKRSLQMSGSDWNPFVPEKRAKAKVY